MARLLRFTMSNSTPEILTETYKFQFNLEESRGGILRASGRFGRCDVPTANGRVYPRRLMEREFKRLMPLMSNRGLFGELDHPGDGKTMLKRVSHLITNLEIHPDNSVFGSWEVIPGTIMGKQLEALAEANVQLGVSSRGLGSVVRDHQGNAVVQEDFRLLTYDVVADPAVGDAVPETFIEGYVPDGKPLSEIAYNSTEEAKLVKRLQQEGVANIDDLIAKVHAEAAAKYSKHKPYAVQGPRASARQESDLADQVERDRVEVYNKGLEDGVMNFMENDHVGRDLHMVQAMREHVVATTNLESELLEQAEHIQAIHEDRIETLEHAILRRDDMIARMSHQLREHVERTVLAHHIARVPREHRKHFVEMVGPTSEFSSIELLENHVRVVATEFMGTGRYFDNDIDSILPLYEEIEESYQAADDLQRQVSSLQESLRAQADNVVEIRREFNTISGIVEDQENQISSATSALREERSRSRRVRIEFQKAVAGLREAHQVIKSSEIAKSDLQEEVELWRGKAVELREHLEKHSTIVRTQKKQVRALEEQVDTMRQSRFDEKSMLRESRLEAFKAKAAFGSQNPNQVYAMLAEARTENQVRRIVSQLQESRVPLPVHESFRGGSQIHDHLMSEQVVQSMNQRLMNQRQGAQVAQGSRPDLLSENTTNQVESRNEPALHWPTQQVTESTDPSPPSMIPGLDPSKMLQTIKKHVPE